MSHVYDEVVFPNAQTTPPQKPRVVSDHSGPFQTARKAARRAKMVALMHRSTRADMSPGSWATGELTSPAGENMSVAGAWRRARFASAAICEYCCCAGKPLASHTGFIHRTTYSTCLDKYAAVV